MIRYALAALALLAAPAHGQSLTLANLKGPVARICGTVPATSTKALWAQLAACPTAVPPVADLAPPAAIPSNFDTAALIEPAQVPPSMAPDVVGAFRFICGAGQMSYDDPIVYPGQPGKAHLHQFFGNTGANAFSTYATLRTTGDSTCQNKLNRSGYWVPALLDGKGSVIRPDFTAFYYKRRPASDPWCRDNAICVGLPNGMREIFGWDQSRPDLPGHAEWKCANARGSVVNNRAYDTMAEALAVCTPGSIPDRQLFVTINTPECWNGVIDSPDHRSHTARLAKDNDTGRIFCPATHRYHPPHFTLTVAYTIEDGDDTSLWRFSSDHMKPGGAPGETFHADALLAWDPATQATWTANCIDKMLSCADGVLGNGTAMKRGPFYPATFKAVPRLVPVP